MNNKQVLFRLLSVIQAVTMALFILSFSIGLPIYVRPFYYAHISLLDLPQESGYTSVQIRTAYDEVMDYLTLPGHEFSTGEIPHSPAGAAHFADCKILFTINSAVLLSSSVILLTLRLVRKKTGEMAYCLGKHTASAWGAGIAVVLPLLIGLVSSINFSFAFEVFHHIVFPGKRNWLFKASEDPIILALPERFFIHCALLIAISIVLFAVFFAVMDRRWACRNGRYRDRLHKNV